jgi:hypothetical protein
MPVRWQPHHWSYFFLASDQSEGNYLTLKSVANNFQLKYMLQLKLLMLAGRALNNLILAK